MAVTKTLNFLPSVFRTDTNDKFLSATVDQLVSQPNLTKLYGYIGRKFAPTYKAGDSYITESELGRQNYQLEPSVVVTDDSNEITFFASYTDLLNKIKYYGGAITNQDRLFDSEYYSFDPLISYDKLVNFSQYYWLPDGPDPVAVNTSGIELTQTIVVNRDESAGYTFTSRGKVDNSLTFARAGTYTFIVNQPGFPFWIQSELGTAGLLAATPTISSRDVYGVTNNGIDVGTITFSVPLRTAQDRFVSMPTVFNVEYATPIPFSAIQNQFLSQFLAVYPQYAGITGTLNNKYVIFIDQTAIPGYGEASWTNPTVVYATPTVTGPAGNVVVGVSSTVNLISGLTVEGSGIAANTTVVSVDAANLQITLSNSLTASVNDVATFTTTGYDAGNVVAEEQRFGIWQVKFVTVPGVSEPLVKLIFVQDVAVNEKVYIRYGVTNANKEFYKDYDGMFYQVPLLTSLLDKLYIQDSTLATMNSSIKIVDFTDWTIDVEEDILGQTNYTSPNGVEFTSGLKIQFDVDVIPASYREKEYYVEGVGDSIRLVDVDLLVRPETYLDELALNYPDEIFPEYITINRASLDLNPWSRNNRWFHRDVIAATATYNNSTLILDQNLRAKRPIVQFNSDLQLFNSGRIGKSPIDILDLTITAAFSELQGKVITEAFGVELFNGMRVIFANDQDPLVRNKIYELNLVQYQVDAYGEPIGEFHVNLTPTVDSESQIYDSVIVTGGSYKGSSWWFNGVDWVTSQSKTHLQQEPLFDVFDRTGKSFSEYNRSTFVGTKLFGYLRSSAGTTDSVLGFPLSYRNFSTQGEIEFQPYFETDTFTYVDAAPVTTSISTGFIHNTLDRNNHLRCNIWKTAVENTKQYQLIGYIADGQSSSFSIDISASTQTKIPYIKVYQNYQFLTTDNWMLIGDGVRIVSSQKFTGDGSTTAFTVFDTNTTNGVVVLINDVLQTPLTFGVSGTTVNFLEAPADGDIIDVRVIQIPTKNDKVDILIYNSETTSQLGSYQTPINLELNAQNKNISSLTLGQIRNHLVAMSQNSTTLEGNALGVSNLRDIEIKQQGGAILQNSAPVTHSALFLLDNSANYINALRHAQQEYSRFKNKFLELSVNLSNIDTNDVVTSVDTILTAINSIKNRTFPWYYSDMVPYGTLKNTITRTVFDPLKSDYELTQIFSDQELSNRAVLVYLNDVQLVKGLDYIFLLDRPAIRFINGTFDTLEVDDTIKIVEYSNTDGNYIPETPTKLGLYPKYRPEIFEDDTYRTSTNVIRGHDGSVTPSFGDYRDDFLLELEKRIYNNIKVPEDRYTQDFYTVIPGKFRNNEYTLSEANQILNKSFLNWLGTNKLDFSTNNTFKTSDPFTWNFSAFIDRIDGEYLPGSWRACYRYFYDTIRPHLTPWEMLGFSTRPDWWIDFYGPGPYTGTNKLLWDDLEAGRIRQGDRAGIDPLFVRPGLSQIIPLDDSGNLLSPVVVLTAAYRSNQAGGSWNVGQVGPIEHAWRTSSEFPFAVQQALALAKPGRYFGLYADVYGYAKNVELNQYLTADTNRHITQQDIGIHGDTAGGVVFRGAGYLNWIVDYLTNQGINPVTKINSLLHKYEVKLAYKVAGFTDHKYLQILAEQVSPASTSDSIVIPDENYKVHLYKSTPVDTLNYSAVIVEKTNTGYSVRGYNLTNPYFTIIPSEINNNSYQIAVLNKSARIYNGYQNLKITVPYGYEFTSQQQVVDFLVSYERYLIAQGFVFEERDNDLGEIRNWKLSAKEFLFWAQQGWKEGSVLVLSPVANTISVITAGSIVDGVEDSQYGSKVLDQNYNLVKTNNYTILRSPTNFKLSLTEGSNLIGFIGLNLVQYEHVLIFDNTTVFNDVIYQPESGNRQYRLKLIGQRTAGWDGSLTAPGFIYNSGLISSWNQGKDYLKGDLVEYKNQYYTALENVIASPKFEFKYWKQIESSQIKTGLLPNFSTLAASGQSYYDSYGQIKDKDQIENSHALIGFKPRQYLSDLGLTETSQIEFYKGYIKQKGTANAINQMLDAVFNNLNSDIKFYEEWAVRVGEYGALASNPFVEVALDEKAFGVNPAVARFLSADEANTGDGVTLFNESHLHKSYGDYTGNIALNRTINSYIDSDIPNAGYVNLADVDLAIFDLANYQDLNLDIASMGSGYTIWCAKDFNQNWNVYRVTETNVEITSVSNSLNGYVTFTTAAPHSLSKNDLFVVQDFDTAFNGFYQVTEVDSLTSITVFYKGDTTDLTTFDSSGLLLRLDSLRFQFMEDTRQYLPPHGWQVGEKVWIDEDAATSFVQGQPYETINGTWKVYERTRPWDLKQPLEKSISGFTSGDMFGTSVKMSADNLVIVAGAPYNSNTGIVNTFLKGSDDSFSENAVVTPDAGNAAILTRSFGKSVDLADNNGRTILGVGAPHSYGNVGFVYVYDKEPSVSRFTRAQILWSGNKANVDYFGSSIAFNQNGDWLYVGAPGAPNTPNHSGTIYVYGLNRFVTHESTTVTATHLTTLISVPWVPFKAQDANCLIITSAIKTYIPGIDYELLANNTVKFGTSIGANIDITITQQPYYQLITTLSGNIGAGVYTGYGTAVSSSFDGAQIATGAPQETVNIGIRTDGVSVIVPVGTSTAGIASYLEHPGAGKVWVYDRVIEAFKADGGIDYVTQSNIASVYKVTIDNIEVNNYYIIGSNTVRFVTPPPIGKVIFVETNEFNLLEKITGDDEFIQANANLGTSLTICSNNCAIYVGAPYYDKDVETNNTGAVYKFHNRGRLYGTNTGSIQNPTFVVGDSIRLDNFEIVVTGTTLDDVVQDINNAGILGVSAVNENGYLRLNSDKTVAKNRLRMLSGTTSGTRTAYEQAGLEVFAQMQLITNPFNTPSEYFGTKVKLAANAYMLVIGSGRGSTKTFTTFDNEETAYDSSTTVFNDIILGSGSVYIYELYDDPRDAVEHPGRYQYCQQLNPGDLHTGDQFGYSLDIEGRYIVIGAPTDDTHSLVTLSGNVTANIGDTLVQKDRFGNPLANYTVITSVEDDITVTASPFGHLKFNIGSGNVYINNVDSGVYPTALVEDTGEVYVFENPTKTRGWNLIRYQQDLVDIESVSRLYLYNDLTSTILSNLQFIDPAKGKILGQAEQEISYKTEYDPAIYNRGSNNNSNINPSVYWSENQVDQVWWDLSTVRFVDYEQDSISYRSLNWGTLFPGSTIGIYEWVKSTVLPSQYVDAGNNGVPRYADDSAYVEETYVDPTSNIISTNYYYWVTDKTSVNEQNPRRHLPLQAIKNLIENPKNQGIAYAAIVRNDTVILYNVGPYLSASDTILHIDYQHLVNTNIIHSEYELIQQGNPDAVLPKKVTSKLVDSLSGIDALGRVVPDPKLNVSERYGIDVRPRQSLFIDRFAAVSEMVSVVNKIFAVHPIAKEYDLTSLNGEEALPSDRLDPPEYNARVDTEAQLEYLDVASLLANNPGYKVLVLNDTTQNGLWVIYTLTALGDWEVTRVQSYKNSLYWDYVDWYATGYSASTKPTYSVDSLVDALKLTRVVGDIIKITNTGNGEWQLVLVEDATGTTFTTIGIQNGTIQLNQSLGNFADNELGFGNQGYSTNRYDQSPDIELRSIITAIKDTIFVRDLSGKFNDLFFAMINYLLTEQTYVDWLFKSSFVSVTHQLRTLQQFPNYIRDNQTYYQDYIDEVKPYRTKVREYLINYTGADEFLGSVTDFDLPAYYDSVGGIFRSPSGEYGAEDTVLWQEPQYNQWYQNRLHRVVDIIVTAGGLGYTEPPVITIQGGQGTGATATATLNGNTGAISSITVTNSGSGFLTTPAVIINGSSTVPASAYVVLDNNKIRTFDTTLRFDRVNYSSGVKEWQPNTVYTQTTYDLETGLWFDPIKHGDVISYATMEGTGLTRRAYSVKANMVSGSTFVATDYEIFDVTKFANANDRIIGFYQPQAAMPARDLTQLVQGIDYPGVRVQGAGFEQSPNFSGATRANLSLSSNVTVYKGNVVAQAPEYDAIVTLTMPVTVSSGTLITQPFGNIAATANATVFADVVSGYQLYVTYNNVDGVGFAGNTSAIVDANDEYTLQVNGANINLGVNIGDVKISSVTTTTGASLTITANVTNSNVVTGILTSTTNFRLDSGVVSIDGITTSAHPTTFEYVSTIGSTPYGEIFDNVDIDPSAVSGNITFGTNNILMSETGLDTVIQSSFTDSLLGTRAEDINVDGGAYIDAYSSHAPEELIPGQMFDTLDMTVYTKINSNANVIAYRVFNNMLNSTEYLRVSDTYTTTLTQALLPEDTEIHVANVAVLTPPNIPLNKPGVIFVETERITFWTANVAANTIGQIRRGTGGTAIKPRHFIGDRISDAGENQQIPGLSSNVVTATTGNIFTVASSTAISYKLAMSANIRANIGDFITQSGSSANATVTGTSGANVTVLLVTYADSNRFNLTTQSNIAINGTAIGNTYPVSSTQDGYIGYIDTGNGNIEVTSNGTANVVANITLVTANINQWYNFGDGISTATDGLGFDGSTTEAVMFLKDAFADNLIITTVSDLLVTEDAVNTITTEDGHILVEEDQE